MNVCCGVFILQKLVSKVTREEEGNKLIRFLCSLTFTVSSTSEIYKEISERQKISDVNSDGKLLTRGLETIGNNEITDSGRHTD